MYAWIIEADLYRFRKALYFAETSAERERATMLVKQAEARLNRIRAANADELTRAMLKRSGRA